MIFPGIYKGSGINIEIKTWLTHDIVEYTMKNNVKSPFGMGIVN
jgi:hypothetical protein